MTTSTPHRETGATLRPSRISGDFERPYPPGWFDRLVDWIDRLPGPNVAYCLGLLLALFAYLTGVLWLNGKLPVGDVDLQRTFAAVVAPYLLWVRFRLDHIAAASLDRFRPVLAVNDAEFGRLRYELTTLPQRTTSIVACVAAVCMVVQNVLLPDLILLQYAPSVAVGLLELSPVGVFTVAILGVSGAQALHQLRMVDRIHDRAVRVDVWHSKPLHAFSTLTAGTGVSVLLLAYYIASIRPDLLRQSLVIEMAVGVMVPIAIASFVAPLYGMHLRLAQEKDRMLAAVALRLHKVVTLIHDRVDRDVLDDADALNKHLDSLAREREALTRASTWPWESATVTGFVSALVAPAVLWLVRQLLHRFGL